ncbi:hypothetical protein EYZ11_013069 [Aspergillus tanneri]|uniref:Uncharacterized protein n=1 Tax=Aspergillus tanneri TaxID=1220188 RepID=A0A4S3IYN7_9EURO|nr:hypothetical protein EYZ11_013069 [Aspergillus tanneri]
MSTGTRYGLTLYFP